MKKFTFRLDRAMDWRRTQVRIEQAKLEKLFAETRNIDARQEQLRQQRATSEQGLLAEAATTGLELGALDTFRRFAVSEHVRLESQLADCHKRIAAQIQVVAEKRRDTRLLERLKEQRLKTWTTALGREIDQQADEGYLARWKGPRMNTDAHE